MANKELDDRHMRTRMYVKTHFGCKHCPCKVYNDDNDVIIYGTGNIYSDVFMILPSYDVKYKQNYFNMLDIIEKIFNDITGENVFEKAYITRGVKCFNKANYDITIQALNHCAEHLKYELLKIHPRKVIIFDKNCYDLFDGQYPKFEVFTIYSPAVMLYDDDKLKDTFIKDFKSALGYDR